MTRRPGRWLVLAATAAGLSVAVLLTEPFERSAGSSSLAPAQPRVASDRLVHCSVYLGRSVRGRPIYATELGDPDNEHRAVVVGVIHGNEVAGRLIDQRLATRRPPREALVWTIKELNPDGVAAGTRQNTNGVDLNRNFPWDWRPLGTRGDLQYSGPKPLSEPETRIARSLILRVRPGVTIWFHQPLGVVDESGGSVAVERRFSRLVGLPLRRLTRYPGSAASWQNHRLRGTTAFVVELPPQSPSPRSVRRYAGAVLRLAS
jgi:murein peptide amidase A